MNCALPLMQFDTTPPPAEPASSPVLVLYTESLIMTGFPSAFTVVAVCAASDDLATFGYGIGTGPPGVGVLHTSGKTGETPPESLCTIVIGLLTSTVTPILVSWLDGVGKSARSAAGSVDSDRRALDGVNPPRARTDPFRV